MSKIKYSRYLTTEVVDGKTHYKIDNLYSPFNVERVLIEGGCSVKDAKFFSSDPQRSMVIINLLLAQGIVVRN